MSATDIPALGVVISRFGRPKSVRRAVQSVLRQRAFDEVIVVDDALPLPVDLADISEERLRVIGHETTRGVCAARNTGTEAARARHLIFQDDDDALSPWGGLFLPSLDRQINLPHGGSNRRGRDCRRQSHRAIRIQTTALLYARRDMGTGPAPHPRAQKHQHQAGGREVRSRRWPSASEAAANPSFQNDSPPNTRSCPS